MFDVLFCFDENFNDQATVSINSLLTKVSEPINIHIIHNNSSSFETRKKILLENNNLNEIYLYDFDNSSVNLPIVKTHISEATYYRLFISEYLPSSIDYVLYLDSDIICLNSPLQELEKLKSKMELEKTFISARVETTRDSEDKLFERLKLKNNFYFNAGVLFIDFKKWKENKIYEKILNILKNRFEDITDYDQELLNVLFDGKFTQMKYSLNYQATGSQNIKEVAEIKKDNYFLHYLGRDKPWEIKNLDKPITQIYQKEYRRATNKKYHLVFRKNKNELKNILKIILLFRFLKLEYPFFVLKTTLSNLIKK